VSLKGKILIPTIAFFAFMMGVSVAITYYFSSHYLNRTAREHLESVAKQKAELIDVWVGGLRGVIESSASREEYAAVLRSDSEDVRSLAKGALSEQVRISGFSFMSITNTEGLVIASTVPEAVNKVKVADREHFQRALKGEVYVSDVQISRTTGKPSFNIDAPIRAGGKIIGVVFCVLDLEKFSQDFIDPVKILRSGYIAVSDSTGIIFAHKDRSMVMKLKLAEFDFGREMLKLKNGEIEYTFQDKQTVASIATCKTGWILLAVAPKAEVMEHANSIGMIGGILMVAGLAIMALILYLIVRTITRPLDRVVVGLDSGADHVRAAASQLSSSSQSLTEGSSAQAASIEETSASLEEMASMTKQNAENANQANRLMAGTKEIVSHTNQTMEKLTTSMGEISKASEETSKIIKTIDEIAFQTNLLALNAAVEAARAGEAGAGFAVVADEVRNLAMRAAEAAKNTAHLIEGTVKRVKEGSELVEKTDKEFREVAESVGKSGELIGEISAASQEQAQGIEQVNRAVSEMDKVVQQNASSAEESASASEDMNAQAERMKDYVGELRSMIDGVKGKIIAQTGKGRRLNYSSKGKTEAEQVIPFDNSDF
jgi:methyl-accepting chemotaxis protein